jgi:aspartyl-tRNA(Asn)/glutamyl-tRNA(Gln) amidotransferase subunit C
VDAADIEKLAKLARLNIAPDQVAEVADRISNVLTMVDQLQALDTTGVAPMSHPLDAISRLRADTVTEPNVRDAFMAIAPASENGLYLVPKVID